MATDLYVALSGQLALDERLTTVAGNVANLSTAGFRAEEVSFEWVLSRAGRDDTAFVSSGSSYISRRAGPAIESGNPLDVMIIGEGWIALETPDGIAYTRDGRMQLSDQGELQSVTGHFVLDAGGGRIAVAPAAGPVQIAADGTITQGGAPLAILGLFTIPETAQLARYGDTAIVPDEEAFPVEDPAVNRFRQGFYEGANVNPVMELTSLILIQRSFEYAAAAVQARSDALNEAIDILGRTS